MNYLHRRLCRSERWKQTVEKYALPWTLEDINLGDNVLEVGPGPGVTTELIRARVARLTCVEIDCAMADSLAQRTAGSDVTVVCEDATAMSLPSASFDSAVSFTMLHHVQSPALQDWLLREVARVLRGGGVFAGSDSVYSRFLSVLHIFDTMVLVDPRTFPSRLEAAGFIAVRVDTNPYAFRFRAIKPA